MKKVNQKKSAKCRDACGSCHGVYCGEETCAELRENSDFFRRC
jgi:hypothetical protein